MIAQASIDELLSGTGEIVYSVTLRDETEGVYGRVKDQAWVSQIEVTQRNGQTKWQVSVTDEAVAEDQLLNLLVSNGAKVADFGRKEYALEDIFLDIVERSKQ